MSDPHAALDQAKQGSTLELLFRCARLTNEAALARVRAATGHDVRASHTALLPHIDLEGTRLTELARRVGVSKQAVAQLVDEMVEQGALEKVPDPSDGRAKLIRFARGGAVLLDGLGVLQGLEADLRRDLGDRRVDELRATLQAVLDAVEGRGAGS